MSILAWCVMFLVSGTPVWCAQDQSPVLRTGYGAGQEQAALSATACQLAGILKVKKSLLDLQSLRGKSRISATENLRAQRLRWYLTERILRSFLEVQQVNALIEEEIATDKSHLVRVSDITNRGVTVTNTSNFTIRGTLGMIGSANRIANLSLTGNLLQLCGSIVSVSFSTIALHKMKGPREPGTGQPNLLSKILGLPSSGGAVDYPPALWDFLNMVPPGRDRTRREELLYLWRQQGNIPDDKNASAYRAALAGANPRQKVNRKLLVRRTSMLMDLQATIMDENNYLLELLSAVPELPGGLVAPRIKAESSKGDNVALDLSGLSPAASQLAEFLQDTDTESGIAGPLTPRAKQLAAILEIEDEVYRLRVLMQERGGNPAGMREDALRKQLTRQLVTAMLAVHSVFSRVDAEMTRTSDQLRTIKERTRRKVQFVNSANFTSKGFLGGTGSVLNIALLTFAGNSLQLYGNALSVVLALVSFHTGQGPKLKPSTQPGMLAKVLGFPADSVSAAYPRTVWRFLNDVPLGKHETRLAELIERWSSRGYISLRAKSVEDLKALSGMPTTRKVTVKFLAHKAEMLEDLNAKVIEENVHLLELYQSIISP